MDTSVDLSYLSASATLDITSVAEARKECLASALSSRAQEDHLLTPDDCIKRLVDLTKERVESHDAVTTPSGCLLNTEQKVRLSVVKSLLKGVKEQQPHKWFDVVNRLTKEIFPLAVLWELHTDDILPLQSFFDSALRDRGRCSQLTEELIGLCSSENDTQTCRNLLTVVCSHLVQNGFPEKKSEDASLRKVCVGILDGVTRGLLDSKISEREVLLHTDGLGASRDVSHICFKKFCTHTISLIMSHRPNMKVSEALKRQKDWKSGKVPDNLKTLYKQLLVPFESGEVVEMLRRILEKQEVNWQTLLSFLATFLVCFTSAAGDIQDHVTRLLAESLENGDMENTIVAFLLARQSCVEGPHVFPSYPQWFQQVFGDSGTSPAGSKKAFTFMMKFLTDLVPFEPADVLKVHILRPPFIPAKCRDLWTDYTLLAKTRLADLKEPLEETNTSIYSDQGNTNTSVQSTPGLQDVEKAIAGFESSGKLPTNVMEASIFRKPYFVGKFLPALLQPRHLPDVPDSRMKFIEALKKAGKIPSSLVTKYEEACRKETRQLLDGVFEVEEEDGVEEMMMEPLEQLRHRLKQLFDAVMSSSANTRVSELVSVISEKIEGVVGKSTDGDQCPEKECVIDRCQPDLIPAHVQVVDEVLNCVCRIVHGLKDASNQSWLHQLVRMLSQHFALLPALFVRLLELFCCQPNTLSEHHTEGTAAFVFHLSNNWSLFPTLFVRQHHSKEKHQILFLSYFLSNLPVSTAEQMTVTHQFLMEYLKTAFLWHSGNSSDCEQNMVLPPRLIVMFCILSWRLVPETQPWNCQSFSQQLLWQHISQKSQGTRHDTGEEQAKYAVLAVYTSERFQELLKTHKATLEDFVNFELSLDPKKDTLSPLQRSAYQCAMVGHFCATGIGGEMDPVKSETGDTHIQSCCSLLMKKIVLALSRCRTESGKCPRCQEVVYSNTTDIRPNEESALKLLALLAKLVQNIPPADNSDSVWLVHQVSTMNTTPTSMQPTCLPQALLRVVLRCPAYLLFMNPTSDRDSPELTKHTIRFIDEFLMVNASEGGVLSLDVICHLLQLVRSAQTGSMMKGFEDHPVIVLSTLVHLRSVCVLVPSLFGTTPWKTLPLLLGIFDRILQEGTLSGQQIQSDSFTVAAAAFAVIKQRGLLCGSERKKEIVKQLHNTKPKAVEMLSDLLLVAISNAQSCSDYLQTQAESCQLWLLEIWQQFLNLMPHASDNQSEFAYIRRHLLPDEHVPFMEVAILRCLGHLKPELAAGEKGVAAMAVHLFSRLCQRFEDTHSSQQFSDVGALLKLSQTVLSLVRLVPLSLLQDIDMNEIKQCGLEILAVYHQRMKART